jgi:hypothetical protein
VTEAKALFPADGFQPPKTVFLTARINFDAVLHAPLARHMMRAYGTRFIIWVASERRRRQWREWLGDGATILVEEEIIREVDAQPLDEAAVFAAARAREVRYGISYHRHVLLQDKGVAAYYLQHTPNSAFARRQPIPLVRMVARINRFFEIVEDAVQESGMDLLIARNSGILNSVANAIARHHGIPSSWLNHLRTGKHMTWMEGPDHGSTLISQEAALLDDVKVVPLEDVVPPDDTKWALERISDEHRLPVIGRQLLLLTLDYALHMLNDLRAGRRGSRLSYFGSVKNILNRRHILRYLHDNATRDVAEATRLPFALFLLHLDPEYTSSTLARDFNHVHAMIQQMAISLPVGMRLLIKEHVWGLGNRAEEFYRSLAHLPNVIFVDHRIRSTELAAKAEFVSTMAGTIAIEASLIGKPVLIFTPYVEYAHLSNVEVVRNIAELPRHVRSVLRPRTDDEIHAVRLEAAKFREAQKLLGFELPELELNADGNMNRHMPVDAVAPETVENALRVLFRIVDVQRKLYVQRTSVP